MKLDFHTHGKLAKKLPFSEAYTDWLFEEAKKAGLDALCLTEHFNTLQFEDVYRYLIGKSRREGDTLVLESGLRVFAGMETDIAEGGHVLTLGTPEDILELNHRLEPYKEPGRFLPFGQLLKFFREYPVKIGAAIPSGRGGISPSCLRRSWSSLIFWISTEKTRRKIWKGTKQKTYSLGTLLNRPVIGGQRYPSGSAVRVHLYGVSEGSLPDRRSL